jgi:hypothetical protein
MRLEEVTRESTTEEIRRVHTFFADRPISRFSPINGKYLHTSADPNPYLLYSFPVNRIFSNKDYVARGYATFVDAMYADMPGGHPGKTHRDKPADTAQGTTTRRAITEYMDKPLRTKRWYTKSDRDQSPAKKMPILSISKTLATLINHPSETVQAVQDTTMRRKVKSVIPSTETRETEDGRLGGILLVAAAILKSHLDVGLYCLVKVPAC